LRYLVKKLATNLIVSSLLVTLTWLWASSHAAARLPLELVQEIAT